MGDDADAGGVPGGERSVSRRELHACSVEHHEGIDRARLTRGYEVLARDQRGFAANHCDAFTVQLEHVGGELDAVPEPDAEVPIDPHGELAQPTLFDIAHATRSRSEACGVSGKAGAEGAKAASRRRRAGARPGVYLVAA